MSGNAQNVFLTSPVFTREDEERYHYVDTEVGGSTAEEDGEFESLIDGRHVSVGCDQHESADQGRKHVRDSMVRDSLDGDYSDVSDSSNNRSDDVVVADPSRYEDLRVGATDRRDVPRQARPDVVAERGDSESQPRRYYLPDDVEEYEETQLVRQRQQREARRAHVPHLELSHSDDEPTNGEAAFDLELDDGRGAHAVHQKHASQGHRCRVSFGALPRNTDSAGADRLTDPHDVAERHPDTGGGVGGNPDYERIMYADHHAYDKNERRGLHNSADTHSSVYRTTHASDTGHYNNVPVEAGRYQGHAAVQSSSAKRQQLSGHSQPYASKAHVPQHSSHPQSQGQLSQTSNVRRKPDDGPLATDFVEANRQNVSRKTQKTYGQMYSRKMGKENAVDFDRSAPRRHVNSASSAPGHEKVDAAPAFAEQNSYPQDEQSSVPSAERLWHDRSRWLAARKESAKSLPGGKNRRCTAAPPQNRVARDVVRTNDSRPVMLQATTSVPGRHESDVQQYSAGSFTVPVRSELPAGSAQKVSVDINLNVVSPRPLLSQPSTSLPIQYTPQDVYQYSSRTQAFGNDSDRHRYPAAFQPPLSNVSQPVPQSTAVNPVQYTAGPSPLYTVFPHPHSAPHFISSGRHQPTPRFIDNHGQLTPNHAGPQHLPVTYNYGYHQPSAVPASEASQLLVHPYQMQVFPAQF